MTSHIGPRRSQRGVSRAASWSSTTSEHATTKPTWLKMFIEARGIDLGFLRRYSSCTSPIFTTSPQFVCESLRPITKLAQGHGSPVQAFQKFKLRFYIPLSTPTLPIRFARLQPGSCTRLTHRQHDHTIAAMAPTTHIPAAADGSDNESKSNPVPAVVPHVGHLKPILIGPGTAVKDSKKEDVPSTELGLLLMDFSTKKMDMHDLDIILLLTSNNALPLLRAFDEKLQGDDDLSKAVDTQLLGNDFSAQDPLNLEKFATHAENFAEKIMLYKKDPVKFERTHSPHQVFLAQCIMHFLNDNSAEANFSMPPSHSSCRRRPSSSSLLVCSPTVDSTFSARAVLASTERCSPRISRGPWMKCPVSNGPGCTGSLGDTVGSSRPDMSQRSTRTGSTCI